MSVEREDVVVERLVGFSTTLRSREDGTYLLEGTPRRPLPSLSAGERIRVTRAVPGDATYAQPGRVIEVDPSGVGVAVVRLDGEPERRQQRQHVRVQTPEVHVVLTEADGPVGTGALLNVSAGGLRASVKRGDVQVGRRFRVEFELPPLLGRPLPVSLDAEIVWTGTMADGRRAVGLQFVDADDRTEQALTSWVFRKESSGSR